MDRNGELDCKEVFYLEEIRRLNEIIQKNEENMLVIKNQMEIQEKLMNMVVHDMRNPSEAINNGLTQVKDIIRNEMDHIFKELKDSFQSYLFKIKDFKTMGSQIGLENNSVQFQVLDMEKIKLKSFINLSPISQENNLSSLQIIPRFNEKQQEEYQIPKEQQKRQQFEEEKFFDYNVKDQLDISENLIFQSINQKINIMEQLPGNRLQINNNKEEKKNDYASQIKQFINFEGNGDQIQQKNEKLRINQNQQDQEMEQINIKNIEIAQDFQNCIKEIQNDIQACQLLLNQDQNNNIVQNLQVQIQDDQIQEEDNYSDFHSEDLDEISQPLASQKNQPALNKIN